MKKEKKISFGVIVSTILLVGGLLFLVIVNFDLLQNKTPNELYTVYLSGNKIGTVKSGDEFNNYINLQEEKLKEKYEVDTIYAPKGVEIKKVLTYEDDYDSNEKIYNLLVSSESFTIKGIVIEIKKEEEIINEENGEQVAQTIEKVKTINVLNKEIFDNALVEIVKAFVEIDEYDAFMTSTQKEIEDVGEIIEDIYIQEEVTYHEDYIPTSEYI